MTFRRLSPLSVAVDMLVLSSWAFKIQPHVHLKHDMMMLVLYWHRSLHGLLAFLPSFTRKAVHVALTKTSADKIV